MDSSSNYLFPVTFDAAKLEEDKERIRDAYQKEGYFTAKALDQTLKLRNVGGANGGWHIPLIKENRPGKVEDITLPVEEGQRLLPGEDRFPGRQTVPLYRVPRPPFPDAAGRCFLYGKAAKWA